MSDAQWQKLDGEPTLVRTKGEKYQEIADAINRAKATLDKIVDDASTTAKSMDATKSLASDVREDITKATDRYRYTGEALVDYAGPLDTAISDSDTAATKIAEYELELNGARIAANNAQYHKDGLRDDASSADVDEANDDLTAANDRVSDLEQSLSYWQGQWESAKSAKDSAARTAKDKIDEVVTGDKVNGLEDSTWDKIKHVAASLYKVFKIICDVAGILAIFLSWVPVLGQVLLVLAAIGSILTILETIVQFAKGEIGWGGLLLGVGLGVLGLFGGKLAGTLTDVAKARAITKAANLTNSQTRLATRLAGNVDDGLQMITDARAMANNADNLLSMKSVLKSPFQRSDAMAEMFELRKAGNLTFMEGLSRAGKEAFVFPLKSPFGGSSDLLRNPVLYHNADGLVGAAVTMNLVDFGANAYKAGDGFAKAFSGEDGWKQYESSVGVAGPVTNGPYVNIAQMPSKVVDWAGQLDSIV